MRLRALTLPVVAALVACGEPPAPPASSAVGTDEPALLARLAPEQREGKAIFESICWTCHGPAGRGNGPSVLEGAVPPPPDFVAEGYAATETAELVARFRAGIEGPDTTHPHMAYVLDFLPAERFRSALSYVPALAWPPEVPGSALHGMALYRDRCTGCHGVEGDGEGYAGRYLEMVRPADFTADTLVAARDFEGLFRRIKEGGRSIHGSAMPPWGQALDDRDIWDLVAYIATFQPGTLGAFPGDE